MARSNGNQDRTGGQPARQQYAGEGVDHGLPWNNASAAAHPQGYDQQAPGQLPWPQGQGQPQQAYQHPQGAPPLQQYQAQQGMPQGYAPPQYPQTYAPQPDAHHGHYFPQPGQAPPAADQAQYGYPQNGYAPPSTPAYQGYQDPAAQLRGSYAGHGEAP